MQAIDVIILALYMIGLIVIGIIAKGRIETLDDFILGGRRFNLIALTGTILATMIGSGMTIGAVGNAYQHGAGGTVFWMYTGFAIGLLVFAFMTDRIRETGKRSMGEVIASSYGQTSHLVASLVIIGYAIAIVAINIAGMRTIIINVFGDSIRLSIPMVTVLATFVAILYTSFGGFYAVVWTDTVQFLIMVLGVIILGPLLGLTKAGGFASLVNTYEAMGSSITNPFINGISAGSVGFFLAYFLTVPADPTMPQRALAGKDDATVRNSFLLSGVIGFIFGFCLLVIGASARVLIPNLEHVESALFQLILGYYPPVIKGLAIAAIAAAVMSSFDSFLILATTHIVYDLGQALGRKADEDTLKKVLPYATVIIGIMGLLIALFIQSLFYYLYMLFSIVGSALVPAFIGAIYFKDKTTSIAANASIIVGTLVPAVLYLTVGYDVFLGDPVFLGIISSTLTLIVVSMFTNKKKEKQLVE